MAVDASGNIYITGVTVGPVPLTGNDYATAMYNSSGVFQWETFYNGTAGYHDVPSAIAIDPQGNILVTGASPGTIGGLDSAEDYLTIKYNSAGNEIWTQRYNGNTLFTNIRTDVPTDMVVDDLGNVYVTGTSAPDGGANQNCLTIKYDGDGNQLWTARNTQADGGVALKVDDLGNVYVSGRGSGLTGGLDYITIKYNSAGQELWLRRFNDSGMDVNLPKAMDIDDNGNVYVTGRSEGYLGYLTVKYNSAGDLMWFANYYNVSTNDGAEDIAVDNLGNVFVTGSSQNSGATTSDYATVKYNSDGAEQWASRYTGLGGTIGMSGADAIALDSFGNVYVTGHSEGANFGGDGYDYATIKYNTSGIQQWAIRFNSTESDWATSIYVDSNGKVIVAGESYLNGNSTIGIIKYSQSPTDVQEISSKVPENFYLFQNYPNPFNPSTKIKYTIAQDGFVTLKVFDILGNEIKILFNSYQNSGNYEIVLDGSELSSGIYYYKLQSGDFVAVKKLVLTK